MVTCMPQSLLKGVHINLKDIKPTKLNFRGVTGRDMKATGSLIMKITCNGETHHTMIIITELGTDASLKGLGTVLIQEGKPVRFLNKSLTKTEADYSNIEREMLAILFACERLHLYIFG